VDSPFVARIYFLNYTIYKSNIVKVRMRMSWHTIYD